MWKLISQKELTQSQTFGSRRIQNWPKQLNISDQNNVCIDLFETHAEPNDWNQTLRFDRSAAFVDEYEIEMVVRDSIVNHPIRH